MSPVVELSDLSQAQHLAGGEPHLAGGEPHLDKAVVEDI
jgi:hypothetical protein